MTGYNLWGLPTGNREAATFSGPGILLTGTRDFLPALSSES